MIPSRRCLWLLGAWSAAALGFSLFPSLPYGWWPSAGILSLVLVLDAVRLWRHPGIEAQRQALRSLALGCKATIRLKLQNETQKPVTVIVHDHVPDALEYSELPVQTRIPAAGWAEVAYWARAIQRGTHTFGVVEYRLASPWGLWWRQRRAGAGQEVRVYPDFEAVAKYTLLARDNRLRELGIHKRQRRGQGREFHQLREYRVGDSLRQIDWNATSRLMKAISREYRDERDQQVVFMLDHGRRMHSRDGELSHLDHALNAVLLLAYVALRQGDAVGLMTFGGSQRWLAPRKGPSFVNTILNAVFDLQSTREASDIYAATEDTLRRIKKRSLFVIITNLRDDPPEDIVSVVRLAQRRHVVLLASMRERALMDATAQPPQSFSAALTIAASHHYLRHRRRAHRQIASLGAHTLDVEPYKLPRFLVNRYLEIKTSGGL